MINDNQDPEAQAHKPKQPKLEPKKDTAQLAVWICDEDPEAKIAWWKTEELPRKFQEAAEANGVVLGPITFKELQPGQENAGHPPDGVQGSNVRLLVGEAEVVDWGKPIPGAHRFSADLTPGDLKTLREATRRAYAPRTLTDKECDQLIDFHGPRIAQAQIDAGLRKVEH